MVQQVKLLPVVPLAHMGISLDLAYSIPMLLPDNGPGNDM